MKFNLQPKVYKMGNIDGQFIVSGILSHKNNKYKVFVSFGPNQGLSDAVYKWSDLNGWQFITDYRNLGFKDPFVCDIDKMLYQERIANLELIFNKLCLFVVDFEDVGKYPSGDLLPKQKDETCLVYS